MVTDALKGAFQEKENKLQERRFLDFKDAVSAVLHYTFTAQCRNAARLFDSVLV